jgi:hypothetical protein
MRLNLNFWALAPVVFVLIGGAFSASASHAALNCQVGSTLQEVAQNVLGIQRGAETADDINVALGIIPDAIISERVREATENAGDLLGKIGKLRDYCELIAAKNDPVEQYFRGIDLLFAATPMAPWVTVNLDMARIIVNGAKNISDGVLSDTLLFSEGVGVQFAVSVSKHRRVFWNLSLTGDALKQSNLLRRARLLVRPMDTAQPRRAIELSVKPDVVAYRLDFGLNDFGIDPATNHLFFEFLWKNGQRSVVPLARGYYKSQVGPTALFPFVLKGQNMVLDR